MIAPRARSVLVVLFVTAVLTTACGGSWACSTTPTSCLWLVIPGTPNAAIEQQPGYPALRVGREGRVRAHGWPRMGG